MPMTDFVSSIPQKRRHCICRMLPHPGPTPDSVILYVWLFAALKKSQTCTEAMEAKLKASTENDLDDMSP
jgi:hypothetical protein